MGTFFQQEIDLLALFADVAVYQPDDSWRQACTGPGRSPPAGRPCRPGASSHLNCPADMAGPDGFGGGLVRCRWSQATRPLRGAAHRRAAGRVRSKAAAELLNAEKKLVILAGLGALGADEELERLADMLAAPIVKPLLGKAVVPDDSPFTTGGIGLLGTLPSEQAMEECDGLFLIGTSFPYHASFCPSPARPRPCRSTIDPTGVSACAIPIDIGLAGDAKATLAGAPAPAQAQEGPLVPREGPGADEGMEGADAEPRRPGTSRRSSRRSSRGTSTTCSPTTPSSRPTRGRSRPGRLAISTCAAA